MKSGILKLFDLIILIKLLFDLHLLFEISEITPKFTKYGVQIPNPVDVEQPNVILPDIIVHAKINQKSFQRPLF